MKVVSFLLMLMVVMHCACMGRCWGEEAIFHATPPCHQHEGQNSPDDDSNLCAEGPALEAKTSPLVNCALDVVDLACAAPALALPLTPASHSDFLLRFEPASPPLVRLTILRI